MKFRVICSSTWDVDTILNLYPHLRWYHTTIMDNNLYINLRELGEITELTSFANTSISLSMGDASTDYVPTIEIVDEWVG